MDATTRAKQLIERNESLYRQAAAVDTLAAELKTQVAKLNAESAELKVEVGKLQGLNNDHLVKNMDLIARNGQLSLRADCLATGAATDYFNEFIIDQHAAGLLRDDPNAWYARCDVAGRNASDEAATRAAPDAALLTKHTGHHADDQEGSEEAGDDLVQPMTRKVARRWTMVGILLLTPHPSSMSGEDCADKCSRYFYSSYECSM